MVSYMWNVLEFAVQIRVIHISWYFHKHTKRTLGEGVKTTRTLRNAVLVGHVH
jgi:hypothetical protein